MTESFTQGLATLIDSLDRAQSFLAIEGQDYVPGVEDIADMLWLATQIDAPIAEESETETETETPEEEDESIAPEVKDNSSEMSPPETVTPPETLSGQPRGLLSTEAPTPTHEKTPVDRLRVPAAAALRDKLELVRALRPLARRVDSRTDRVIDEEATAIALAEGNPVGVVEQPRRERWLDLELVIEQSRIASLWNRAGKEWADVLAGSGLFRSVRVWTIEAVEDQSESEASQPLRLASGLPRANTDRTEINRWANPKELIDPTGRRLVMLLSDCLSPRWWNGEIQPVLADWSSQGPMVVVQWFPPKPYWERTALKLGDALRLTAIAPGLPNHLLDREYLGLNPELELDWFDEDEDELPLKLKGAIVPVVSLEPQPLQSWSRLVAGYGDATVTGRRFELVFEGGRWQGPSKVRRRLPEAGEQKVKLFGQTASRLAQELAGLMSLGPVSPEITNLIQETLLPKSRSVHVAEVFLSGLLEETAAGAYEFVEGAKAALRRSMTTVDEQRVFRAVSGFVSARYGLTPREFEVFLLKRGAELHELELAEVQAFAELRDRQAQARAVMFEPFEITFGEWEMEAETIEAETIEAEPNVVVAVDADADITAPEPVLEEIEYTVAQLEEDEGGDTFDGDQVPVHDASSWPAVPPGVEAVTFEYPVVKLNPDGSEQSRETEHISGFIELLEKQKLDKTTQTGAIEETISKKRGIRLEMVGIPGGEFLMGAADDENGRDDEKPRHRVSVPPFYIGRVPVTQAQWRFVAALDPVDRPLKTNPARFRGDNLPVEQVSWKDATEFCARLARDTGRMYRLPTEAEWEYACRAGTTTPFHFGETLNTDVANYNGNSTYGNGQTGQYRQRTMPVGSLKAANAWGLFDLHGNVWEWCQDDWHGSYEGAPTDGSAWLDVKNENSAKIRRGGSWDSFPRSCRSAIRFDLSRADRSSYLGFRVVCSAPRNL